MADEVVALVRLALDAASLRHQVIANNIANANTPGFVPSKVNFEQQLAFARGASGSAMPASLPTSVRPFIEADAGADARVMLDMEMVKLAQNTVQYQSLLKALDKRGAILSTAITEGRR
jgi:flagellar basal-body rod protein FlgB